MTKFLDSTIKKATILIACMTVTFQALAISASDLEYSRWNTGRPASMTVTSGVMKGISPLFGPPMWGGVTWVDINKQKPMRHLEILCRLNIGSSLKCGQVVASGHHRIEEVYIGPPEGLVLQGGKKTKLQAPLNTADLHAIPQDVKRVILVNVWCADLYRQALTAVFDANVSDDDLRTLVLEDGIYRVYGWRKD